MSNNGELRFTPTEAKILELLSDGESHSKEEVALYIEPELGQTNVSFHMMNIRKKLISKGENILCVYNNRRRFYQHVRLLQSPYNGVF